MLKFWWNSVLATDKFAIFPLIFGYNSRLFCCKFHVFFLIFTLKVTRLPSRFFFFINRGTYLTLLLGGTYALSRDDWKDPVPSPPPPAVSSCTPSPSPTPSECSGYESNTHEVRILISLTFYWVKILKYKKFKAVYGPINEHFERTKSHHDAKLGFITQQIFVLSRVWIPRTYFLRVLETFVSEFLNQMIPTQNADSSFCRWIPAVEVDSIKCRWIPPFVGGFRSQFFFISLNSTNAILTV